MSNASKRFFVWVETTTTPSPQIWPYHPNDRGPDNKQYGPKVIAYHEIPVELNEVADGTNCLWELAKHFPAPTVQS